MFTEADSISDAEVTDITFRASYHETELADAEFKALLVIDDESDAANSENVVESILNELDDIKDWTDAQDVSFIKSATLNCTAVKTFSI